MSTTNKNGVWYYIQIDRYFEQKKKIDRYMKVLKSGGQIKYDTKNHVMVTKVCHKLEGWCEKNCCRCIK